MSLWLEFKALIAINPYLIVLFVISVSFWALFFQQLKAIFNYTCSATQLSKEPPSKPWVNFWFKQNQQAIQNFKTHQHLTLMKALIVSLPMVGLAGTVMMLSNGFNTLSASASVDIKSFSHIVTGAMATTFTGVFLSVIGMLLFKVLDISMRHKYKENQI